MGALLSLFSFLIPSRYLIPTLHFAQLPIHFTVKPPKPQPGLQNYSDPDVETTYLHDTKFSSRMSLKTFVETRVPSLHRRYRPCWWLPTGHVQTGYCVIANFDNIDKVLYKRTLLRLPDGGTLGLDFASSAKSQDDEDPTAPVIVVLHGLSGGSQESYVRSILGTACTPKSEGGLGYRAVVVNFRGCAGVELTSAQFYSAGHTDDIRSALLYISSKYPRAPLLGVGFSLGAGVLTRYLGEEGAASRLKAGCVLACPWNITANSIQLEGRWLSREVYSRAMGGNLIALLKRHLDSINSFPPSLLSEQLPAVLALKNPALKDVDEHMVRVAGGSCPPFPFATADDYYEWAGSHHKLPGIRVPFLAINSIDDPIVAEIPIEEASRNPWVCLALTKYGGHLGWFEGSIFGRHPPHRWVKKPVLEWFSAVTDIVEDLSAGSGIHVGNPRENKNGFVVEPGHPFVGYKVMKTGIDIQSVDNDLLKGL